VAPEAPDCGLVAPEAPEADLVTPEAPDSSLVAPEAPEADLVTRRGTRLQSSGTRGTRLWTSGTRGWSCGVKEKWLMNRAIHGLHVQNHQKGHIEKHYFAGFAVLSPNLWWVQTCSASKSVAFSAGTCM
jgi:hypothetical protein